jgi:hypothetical protein
MGAAESSADEAAAKSESLRYATQADELASAAVQAQAEAKTERELAESLRNGPSLPEQSEHSNRAWQLVAKAQALQQAATALREAAAIAVGELPES